jgi:hypothetical protein
MSFTKGGESNKKGSNDSVFGNLCQRGREHEPKAKGPHHHQFPNSSFSIGTNFRKSFLNWYDFQIGISLCSKGGEIDMTTGTNPLGFAVSNPYP